MRPLGMARQALEKVLQAGVVGTVDVLAQRAGLDAVKAETTLGNMRKFGLVVARSAPLIGGHAKAGRPRVIYQLSTHATRAAHSRELDKALAAWRAPMPSIDTP